MGFLKQKSDINRLSRLLFLIPFLSCCMVGCSNERLIRDKINEMQSEPIDIPMSDMLYICNDKSVLSQSDGIDYPFRLVIYFNDNGCISCSAKRLFVWNSMLYLEEQGRVQFVFILRPSQDKIDDVINSYYDSGLEHSILVDTCGVFMGRNTKIPEGEIFHTFLLDSIGNVVMVGNPLENIKIKEMFDKLVN